MRIRKKTDRIPSGALVIDLDQTVIDAQPFFQSEAKHRGYTLSRPECNANVIKQHLPGDLLHEIELAYYGDGTRDCEAYPGALDLLREYSVQAYLVAGRPTDGQRSAASWLAVHLPAFPSDHLLFYPTTAAKMKALTEFDIALVVDDQIGPLKGLPEATVRVLFDPDGALADDIAPGIRVLRSWEAIAPLIRSTVKPRL